MEVPNWQANRWQPSSPETIESMLNTAEQQILSLFSTVPSTLTPVHFPETPEQWDASFFFNSCKTACSSSGTMSLWKMTDQPFVFGFFWFSHFLFLEARSFLPIPLKTSTGSTFAFKGSHSCYRCAKPTVLKWPQCSASFHMYLFLFPSEAKCMSLFSTMYSLIQP